VPFILVSGEIGEDTAVRPCATAPATTCSRTTWRAWRRRWNTPSRPPDPARAKRRRPRTGLAPAPAELAQHLQTSVEKPSGAIAREIHDDVGGSLTALKFDLDWIRRHARPGRAAARRAALETVTGHAIEASQRIMHNLRPAILEQGLVAALQWMASRFEKRTGIAVPVPHQPRTA
jgi:signal transduction histidine kinase